MLGTVTGQRKEKLCSTAALTIDTYTDGLSEHNGMSVNTIFHPKYKNCALDIHLVLVYADGFTIGGQTRGQMVCSSTGHSDTPIQLNLESSPV